MPRCHGALTIRHAAIPLLALGISVAVASIQEDNLPSKNLRHKNKNQIANARASGRDLTSDPQLSLAGTSMTLQGSGYDTTQGQEALCWRGKTVRYERSVSGVDGSSSSPFDDFHLLGRTTLIEDCSSQIIQVQPPLQIKQGEILRTGETYEFSVHVDTDLSLLLESDSPGQQIWMSDEDDVLAEVKLILCNTHTSGFCTPFVHEESVLVGSPQPTSQGALHGNTHLDSSPSFLTSQQSPKPLALEANISIPMVVDAPGEFFVIAALEIYTQEIRETNPIPLFHRWDFANAILDQNTGRVLSYQEPPTVLTVSYTVEVVSYIAISVAGSVVAALLIATIYYRNSQILKLTQGSFLIVYLICALIAIVCSFLLNPKSDVYCRLSYPILLISIQLMYAITAGRLWRIHGLLSPILKHRDEDTESNMQRAGGRLISHSLTTGSTIAGRWQRYFRKLAQSCLGCFPFLRKYRTTKCLPSPAGLKRTIPYWHLNVAIFLGTLPQLLLQFASLTRQPQQMVVNWNEDGSMGRTQCEYVQESGQEDKVNLLFFSFMVLVALLVVLLAVAFYCRKLPSVGVLNETRQIYDTTMTTMILLLLAVGIILLTDNATSSPDVEYIIWVTVVLWTTVNCALRLMYTKLKMAYKGETVIVSALVREHHRKHREKQEARLKELTARANAFQKCVLPLVKDHTVHAEELKQCFVGEEAIDALVNEGVVSSRWEGTQLGRHLVSDLGLFVPIGGNIQPGVDFQDDFVAYRFREFMDAASGHILPDFQSMQHFRNSVTASASKFNEDEMEASVNRHSRDELEDLAEGFKAYVDCRDRKYHLRTYHNCFIGSEAVDSMLYAGLAKSREEAVKLGQRLERELEVFHHVCDDRPFEDKRLFYRFRPQRTAADVKSSLSTEGDMYTREVNDDWLNFTKRGRGVAGLSQMMRSLSGSSTGTSSSLNMSSTGSARSSRNLTKDALKFVDLVKVRDRKYHMRTFRCVFVGAEAVDSLVYSGMAATRWDAVQLGRSLARELRLFEHVTREHNFNDDWLFYHYTNTNVPKALCWDETTTSGWCDFSESSDGMEHSQLAETAEAFRRCVDVRDRKYRGIRYKACFVGSDAVDSLVFAGIASSRPEAVKLGRYLAREIRLFKCVSGSHVFSDEPLLYSFRRATDLMSLGNSSGSESNGTGSLGENTNKHTELLEKAEAFRKCTEVRDRRYRLRTYKNCFVAVDTVDMMLTNGLAETRQECVQLARLLARELKLFRHVCDDHDFIDAYLFFEFVGPDESEYGVKEDGTPFKLERLADCESWDVNGRLAPVPEASSKSLSETDSKMSLSEQRSNFDGSRPISIPEELGVESFDSDDESLTIGAME